jgi:hypothetical protein
MTCVWDVDFGVGIEGMVGALLGGGGCSREVVREEEGGGVCYVACQRGNNLAEL